MADSILLTRCSAKAGAQAIPFPWQSDPSQDTSQSTLRLGCTGGLGVGRLHVADAPAEADTEAMMLQYSAMAGDCAATSATAVPWWLWWHPPDISTTAKIECSARRRYAWAGSTVPRQSPKPTRKPAAWQYALRRTVSPSCRKVRVSPGASSTARAPLREASSRHAAPPGACEAHGVGLNFCAGPWKRAQQPRHVRAPPRARHCARPLAGMPGQLGACRYQTFHKRSRRTQVTLLIFVQASLQ